MPLPVVEVMRVAVPATGDAAPARGQVGWGAAALEGEPVDRALTRFGPDIAADEFALDRAALGTAAQLIGLR